MRDGIADDGLPASGESRGSTAPLPLGRAIVDAALGRGGSAAELDAFLLEDDPATLIFQWFGPRASALCGDAGAFRSALDRDIAALDLLLSEQVDAVLHNPSFQTLEASWRGLMLLLDAAGNDERVQVRVLSVAWAEIARDLGRASEFDQSALFERIYSDEFGTPGGLPYGLLICDVEVRHRRRSGDPSRLDDVSTLSMLSSIAAAAFAPCIMGAGADLLGVEDEADLAYAQDLQRPFRTGEYARWRDLQRRGDSRFLGITVPRILLRRPVVDDGTRREAFPFREGREGMSVRDWLWGNAAYALGANVIRAFRTSGWFAEIRGTRQDVDGFGLITAMPAPAYSTGEAMAFRRPLRVELTDRKQKQLEDVGLTALSPCHLLPYAAFLSTPSAHLVSGGRTDVANANEKLSAMLQYILCVSRFAHYLKVMARDSVGAYTSGIELEQRLNKWVRQYTIANADASEELKARFPLSGAQVTVTEASGKPGTFACVMQLKPHFQVDALMASLRLYTELHGLLR